MHKSDHPSVGNTHRSSSSSSSDNLKTEKVQNCIHIWKGELNTTQVPSSAVFTNIQSMTSQRKRFRSSAASFPSTTFAPAVSQSASALSDFASSLHPLVMLLWDWWVSGVLLGLLFSSSSSSVLCPLKRPRSEMYCISPFMKDLTFLYLTPHLFINSVCFNWKFG